MERQIGFLGAGAMSEAIVSGLLKSNIFPSCKIIVSDINQQRLDYMRDKYSVKITSDNHDLVNQAKILVLSVKPQFFQTAVTPEVSMCISPDTLVISIMGSVNIQQISDRIPHNHIIRTMPNTPLAVGAGMTAISPSANTSPDELELTKKIFAACGQTLVVPEHQLEAITAISGCGPGYVFMMIDALADAGVSVGLTRETSINLAAQTFFGAGKMVIDTGKHPSVLRDQVTSPGGTTIAGIRKLEQHALRSALIEAVHSVIARSKEISGSNHG